MRRRPTIRRPGSRPVMRTRVASISSSAAAGRCRRPRTPRRPGRSIRTASGADGSCGRCRPHRAHLDREHDLADQIARMRADDAAADDAVRRFVEEELREAFVAAVGDGAARRRPREHRLADLEPCALHSSSVARPTRSRGRCRRPTESPARRSTSSCRPPPPRRRGLRAPPCARASAGRRCRRSRGCAATLVRICLSTSMKPRSETATPALSAPIFLPFGLRPTLISTRS